MGTSWAEFANEKEKVVLLEYSSKLKTFCHGNLKEYAEWLFFIFTTRTSWLQCGTTKRWCFCLSAGWGCRWELQKVCWNYVLQRNYAWILMFLHQNKHLLIVFSMKFEVPSFFHFTLVFTSLWMLLRIFYFPTAIIFWGVGKFIVKF